MYKAAVALLLTVTPNKKPAWPASCWVDLNALFDVKYQNACFMESWKVERAKSLPAIVV